MTTSKLSNQLQMNDEAQVKSIETSSSLTSSSSTTTTSSTVGAVTNNPGNAIIKIKNYRVKNFDWFCKSCDIFCNSQSQYDVHLISQKHKLVIQGAVSLDANTDANEIVNVNPSDSEDTGCQVKRVIDDNLNDSQSEPMVLDENNNDTYIKNMNSTMCSTEEKNKAVQDIVRDPKADYSISQFHGIKAEHYLIPEAKKKGKFEKFGFYCSLCDAYMTGQIQLVMHVKGAKHQYYSPNEIPGYVPSKLFNPHCGNKMRYANLHIAQASTNVTITNTRLQMNHKFKLINSHPAYNGLMIKSQPGYIHAQAYSNMNFHHPLQTVPPTPPTSTPIYPCNYNKSLSLVNKSCPPNPFIQQHPFLGVTANASPVFPSNYPPMIQSTPNTMMNFSYNKLRLNTNTISLTSVNRIDRSVHNVNGPCMHPCDNSNGNSANSNNNNTNNNGSTNNKANNSNESLLNKSFEANMGFYDSQLQLANTSGMSANQSQVQAQHQPQQALYNNNQMNNNANRSPVLQQTQPQHHLLPHLHHQQSQSQQQQPQQMISLQAQQQQHQQNQTSQQHTLLHPCQIASMNQTHYYTNNLAPNSNGSGRLIMINSHSKPIENQNNNLSNNIQANSVHQQAYFRHY